MGLFSDRGDVTKLLDLLVEANREKTELKVQVEYWKGLALSHAVTYTPPPAPAPLAGKEVSGDDGTNEPLGRHASITAMRAREELKARFRASELRKVNDAS